MESEPLLRATDQTRKLSLAGVLGIMGCALLVLASWLHTNVSLLVFVQLLVSGGVLLSVAFLYPAVSVRCPRCNLAWVQWSLRNQPHNRWLHWLLAFVSCPRCGFSRSGTAESPNAP
jgi:hypothetical protein